MKNFRSAFAFTILLALLIATGCLELAGQRITLRHDAAKDELHIMLQYDGIHDSGNNEYGDGAVQVAQAVKNGEALLMEWPFHLQPEQLKLVAKAAGVEVPQEIKDFAGLAANSLTIHTLGFHRDPDGRVGGTQLLTIKNVKAFLAGANRAISAAFLQEGNTAEPEFSRSYEMILAAARKDHAWLSLEGNALKWTMPVHGREWAALKAKGVLAIVDQIESLSGVPEEERKENDKEFLRALLALTSPSVGFSDADGMLTIRIGDVQGHSTIRLDTGKEYKPNLVDTVTKAAPRDVDDSIVKLMLGEKVEKDAGLIAEIVNWGPPEEKVRGLIKLVKANDAKLAASAVKKLEAFAAAWNEKEAIPAAPAAMADTEEYVEAWKKWYASMLVFPLPVIEGK